MHPKIWSERAIPAAAQAACRESAEIITPDSGGFSGIENAEGAIAGALVYDDAVMASAPRLKVIARTGIGVDNVDLSAAERRAIAVCNAPDGPTLATAEHTIALMLAAAKNIKQIEGELRRELRKPDGKRRFYNDYRAVELCGKTLGLAGVGRIGGKVAERAVGLGMKVCAFDPAAPADANAELLPSLEELLQCADVVSLHLPLTADTRRLMNAKRFAMMKPGAIFINAARGPIVDHDALLAAIDSGHLFATALDVTDPEPLPADSPLLARDNIVVTPHIAAGTPEAKLRNFQSAFTQALQVIRGERPPHLVNRWPQDGAR
jgi:phosphoglycerate dehydrogenase-like enzyme